MLEIMDPPCFAELAWQQLQIVSQGKDTSNLPCVLSYNQCTTYMVLTSEALAFLFHQEDGEDGEGEQRRVFAASIETDWWGM